jgi:hypothetical protein
MELTKIEMEALKTAVEHVPSNPSLELSELQLALVGGGVGETIAV